MPHSFGLDCLPASQALSPLQHMLKAEHGCNEFRSNPRVISEMAVLEDDQPPTGTRVIDSCEKRNYR